MDRLYVYNMFIQRNCLLIILVFLHKKILMKMEFKLLHSLINSKIINLYGQLKKNIMLKKNIIKNC